MNAQLDNRRKIKEMEVMVADVINETPDATTLVLFTGNDRLDYKAGHFLTIDPHQFEALERFTAFLEDLKGKKEPPRAYSLTSTPHEKYLAITIKEERYITGVTKYPPLLSPLLVKRTASGMKMVVTGFTGPYTLPDNIGSDTKHIVHICAGSGIVPNYSIIKFALMNHPEIKHTLLYSSKSYHDIIFRDTLLDLSLKSNGKLNVIFTLTREENSAIYGKNFRKGRITTDLLKEIIPDPSCCNLFVCGPAISIHEKREAKIAGIELKNRFFEAVLEGLLDLGVPKDRIQHETYG
ncbi:MAG: oxidoreductase [Ignavibacteriales bacterium]|nr:oxidoreductase [Ignavibacteriales bacterium]